MFGNLFDDDNEGLGIEADAFSGSFSKRNHTGIPSPPRPRLKCNLAGITNQGATCYLNSLIQTLLLTPEFRESLFQIPKHELGNLEDKEKPGSKVRVIPLQLQRLFVKLLLSNRQCVSTRELTESFGWSNNEELQQHDVQELNRILFSAINDSLAGTSGGNLIRDLYHGSVVNQIKCMECETCSEREEDFLDLTLTVAGNNGLESALFRNYVETELLDGKNQYSCGTCNKLVNAKKGAKLRKLPPILSLSLLRFSYDFNKMERCKELGKFAFPLEIDMTPYTDTPSAADKYELFSIVIHQGSAYGGHYHAYIRDVDGLGKWYNPDEAEVHLEPSKESKRLDIQEFDSPLQLIEALLKEHEDRSLTLDKLGSEMMSRTGKSWNSRFKNQYGQMIKFIKKHDDVFHFNQSNNMIHLKDTYSMSDKTSCNKPYDHSRPKSPRPDSGRCWYDFNDSRVFPIRSKDIENEFQGRESAYMLFYRKKYLIRPQEAKNNRSYCINDNLILEVLKGNEEIEREIAEYDVLTNKITLQIHFGCQYEFINGALHALYDALSWMELAIDKRQTVAELLVAIQELGRGVFPSGSVVSRIKELPAGYHIYETVSGDVDQVLHELNISNGDKLLVWDGLQIGSYSDIKTGNDCEPIYITVIYGGNFLKYSAGFPQNMTIKQFVEYVCSIVDIQNKDIVVKQLESDNKTVILGINDDLTLKSSKLQDGDQVWLDKADGDDESRVKKSDMDDKVDSEEVKSTVSAHIVSAVVNSRIRLSFTTGSNFSHEEIILDNSSTVQECLDCMLLQSGLPGENWHLRKTNWCGEAADILDEPHISLKSAVVQDGDHLLVEEGRLPPKGFILLSIWLYPNLPSVKSLSNENTGLLSWITNGIQDLFNGANQTEDRGSSQSARRKHLHMGDIEIWKESTLEELKLQIFTLPQVAELQVPTIDFLRIRKLDGSRLSTILRDHTHSIKRHKVNRTSESLAMQILPTEEKLCHNEIVIEVKQLIVESKSYSPVVEVLWNISYGNGIQNLQQTVADALALPADQILLAKHLPAKYDWMLIKEKENVCHQGKKGKKKVKPQKFNLRQAPYYIKDGDTIGVKFEKDETDFSTEEDREGRKQLAMLAEEKKKKRRERNLEVEITLATPRSRRPEVALTIKVDKFT